jgi:cytochrome c
MNLEFNKIFAAVLCAGIAASFSGFVAEKIIDPVEVEAYGPEAEGGGLVEPQKPEGPEPVLDIIAAADTARGEKLFRACASCHVPEKDGPNGIGPNIWNIFSRGVAGIEDYSYSGALVEAAGEQWEYIELNKYLWKPKKYAPGTKMNFIGLKKPEDRAAMIAYLRTLSDDPIALPTDAQIAAEQAELAPEPEPEATTETEVEKEDEAVDDKTILEDAREEASPAAKAAADDERGQQ